MTEPSTIDRLLKSQFYLYRLAQLVIALHLQNSKIYKTEN